MVPVSPRLRDFLERWLEETVRPTLSPATASNYEMFARLYVTGVQTRKRPVPTNEKGL